MGDRKRRLVKVTVELLWLTLGSTLTAVGIYFFEFLNHFTTGGVSGLSLIFTARFPAVGAAGFMLLMNSLLLLFGFLVIGRSFGLKTVFCSALISLETFLLERLVARTAPLTDEPMLELTLMILLPSVGAAIIFDHGASTGGTDILAMIIKKFTAANISKGLFISDFFIVMLSFPVFGTTPWLFSVVGFFARVYLVNRLLREINTSKYCTVVTDPRHVDALRDFITQKLEKSATVSRAFVGAYRQREKCLFLVALTRKQARTLKKFATSLDDSIFIIVCETDEITGEGFREPL